MAIASPGSGAERGVLRSVRDYWLLEVTRAPDPSVPARLEVLDTEEGLWELEREEGSVRAVPTSSSRVWRRLTAAVAPALEYGYEETIRPIGEGLGKIGRPF